MIAHFCRGLCRALPVLIGMHYAGAAFAAPGDLDGTYGQRGRAFVSVAGVDLQPNSFIQQSDGKTAVIGWTEQGGAIRDFAVVRLNVDGSADTTFDGDGVAIIDFNGSLDQGVGIVQQPDGKLVVVGVVNGMSSGIQCTPCIGAARLNIDGSLDSTFGTGGKLSLTSAVASSGVGIGVAMQGGNIVIGGHKVYNDFIFVRLTSSGSLDTTFGTGGATVVDLGPASLMVRMIAQSDGRFIAVGGANPAATPSIMTAARINADGTIDTTFNGTGMLTTSCNGPCQYTHVSQQTDGKLIFTGWRSLPGSGSPLLQQEDSLVERRNANGSLDATFGSGGQITTALRQAYGQAAQSSERATQSMVDPVGNIIVVGRVGTRFYNSAGNPQTIPFVTAVGRYTSAGIVDTTFGFNGFRVIPFSQVNHLYGVYWEAIDRLADGRLMVMGLGIEGGPAGTIADRVLGFARLSSGAGDPGVFVISHSGPLLENIGSVDFAVDRQAGSTGAVSVSYNTAAVTATAGSDYVATSGTLQWADGDTRSKIVSVQIVSDAVTESSDETFQLVLSNPIGGATLENTTATATIVHDNIAPTSTITLSQTPVAVSESAGSVTVTVTRTGTSPISVNYFTLENTTAVRDVDFTTVSGILVWGTGDTAPKTITIPILNDSQAEPTETFNLRLITAGGAAVFGGKFATISINDDDGVSPPATPPATPPAPAPASGGGGGSIDAWLQAMLLAVLAIQFGRRSRRRIRG